MDEFYKYFSANGGVKKEIFRSIENRIPCDIPIPQLDLPIISDFVRHVSNFLCQIYSESKKMTVFCERGDLYKNILKLDEISDRIFDFIAYFGYQDEIFMRLSAVQRYLAGCLVRFHAIDFRVIKLKYTSVRYDFSLDRDVKDTSEYNAGPYNLT